MTTGGTGAMMTPEAIASWVVGLQAENADLALMIRRLVMRLRKFDGHDVIASQAMILLTKYHLQGSPLRAEQSSDSASADAESGESNG